VRWLRYSCAAISGFVRRSAASCAICASCGEIVARVDRALAGGLAGGQQLAAGAFGEPVRAHRLKSGMRGLQLRARVDAALLPPKPFAIGELRPVGEDGDPGPTELVDRLEVQRVCFGPFAKQRVCGGLDSLRPFRRAHP
jgi:hypothetical protein